jgi:uncharacterized protein
VQVEIENPKPASKVWGGWPTVGLGLAILAIYLVVQSLVAVVFTVEEYISNPSTDLQRLITGLSSNGLMISIMVIASSIAGLGFIFLFIKIRKQASVKEYLELNRISKKVVLISLAIIIGLIVISSILSPVFAQSKDSAFMVDAYKTSVWPVLLGIAVVIFAPVFEEAFFRGFLFVGLEHSSIGPIGTIILTAVTWALLHIQYDIFGMVTILVLGVVFGIVRLKTGSLWSTILLHAIWNLVAIVGTALYVNGIG